MNLFNKLPGFVRSAPGWEQPVCRRLSAILLWGTLLPLALAGVAGAYPFPDDNGASMTRP